MADKLEGCWTVSLSACNIQTVLAIKRRSHSNAEGIETRSEKLSNGANHRNNKKNPRRSEDFFAYEKSLLLSDIQFVDEVLCSVEFIDYPKYITSINIDCSLHFGAEDEVRAEPFPVAVESKTNEFALAVDDW